MTLHVIFNMIPASVSLESIKINISFVHNKTPLGPQYPLASSTWKNAVDFITGKISVEMFPVVWKYFGNKTSLVWKRSSFSSV